MDTFAPVSSVTRKYRWIAVVISVAGAILCGLFMVSKVHADIANPPMESEIEDGAAVEDGLSKWGRMPAFLLLPSLPGVLEGAGLSASNFFNQPTKIGDMLVEVPPGNEHGAPNMAILNLSRLVPKFIPDASMGSVRMRPQVSLNFAFDSELKGAGVYVYLLAPNATEEDVMKDWIHASSEYVDWVVFPNRGITSSIYISKSIVPKRGFYWGLLWEEDHTVEQFHFMRGGIQDYGHNQLNFEVMESSMTAVKPVGFLLRVFNLLGEAGGLAAFVTLVFGCFFVQRFPPSASEVVSSELTLCGTQEDARPDDSEAEAADLEAQDGLWMKTAKSPDDSEAEADCQDYEEYRGLWMKIED